ncbi:MFS transporter [Thalassotalea sp. PS06]|uniref:MFS transporter n=1 Tax=Thalassotalea sp. PS06 TaxID=2594005 RepID=UPI00163DAAEF|nr:MFS transporter [Thalassotalea sp. PS06]
MTLRRKTYATLSGGFFCYFALIGLFMPFASLYLDAKGFDALQIGEILAVVAATKIIGPGLWAHIADKSGRLSRIILLGCILTVASLTLVFVSEGFWPLLFTFSLFMLFFNGILPQLEVLTLTSIQGASQNYARIRLWGSLGFIVATLTSGEILSVTSPLYFPYLAMFWVVLLTLVSTLNRDPNIAVTSPSSEPQTSVMKRIRHPGFICFLISGLLMQISFGPFYNFFALYLRDAGFDTSYVGVFMGVAIVVELAMFYGAYLFFKAWSVNTIFIFCFLITSVRWLLTALYADNALILAIAMSMHAVSFALYHCACMAFFQRYFSHSQQNRAQAMYNGLFYGVGGAVGAIVTGWLWNQSGSGETSFLVASVAAMLGLIFVIFTPKVSLKSESTA